MSELSEALHIPEASKRKKPHQKHMTHGWLPSQGVQASLHKSSKKLKEWRTGEPRYSEVSCPFNI